MRKDAFKLKGTDPRYKVAAHIMTKRSDAMNMTTIDIPVEPLHKYMNEKRKEGHRLSHLALFITAYLHTLAEFPELNRFIVNKKLYARNEIIVGMVVLKGGTGTHGTDTKCKFELTDTVFDVNRKMLENIEENRVEENVSKTDKLVDVILGVPGVLSLGVPFLMWLDKHGWLPKAIIDASPFHMSLGISNLASIKTNHIYHHCYNFGTTSIFITLGNQREVPKRKGDNIVFERTIPMGITMDERIASGAYFALAFRKFRKYLENPVLLENPPEVINPDPNVVHK